MRRMLLGLRDPIIFPSLHGRTKAARVMALSCQPSLHPVPPLIAGDQTGSGSFSEPPITKRPSIVVASLAMSILRVLSQHVSLCCGS